MCVGRVEGVEVVISAVQQILKDLLLETWQDYNFLLPQFCVTI